MDDPCAETVLELDAVADIGERAGSSFNQVARGNRGSKVRLIHLKFCFARRSTGTSQFLPAAACHLLAQ